jgi:hypothetical protein
MALSPDRIVNISAALSPKAGSMKGFGTLAIIGDSDVIAGQRHEAFSSYEDVAARFGTTAPEAKSAQVYFAQQPRPDRVIVARWYNDAEKATLLGGTGVVFNNLKAVGDGAFDIKIDNETQKITGLDLTATTNLNGVASAIQAKLTGATIIYDGKRFMVQSNALTLVAAVGYATPPTAGTGTDLSKLLRLDAEYALTPSAVKQAETPIEALQALVDETRSFYSVYFASNAPISDEQTLEVAQYVDALSDAKMLLGQISNPNVKEGSVDYDLGSQFKALNLGHTIPMFDNNDSHAVCSIAGVYATVNYEGRSTVKTVMHKTANGITSENLTTSEADVLQAKNVNVFAKYVNDTSIIQYGTVANGKYIDSVIGFDWLKSYIQTNVYNLLKLSTTKIPMTNGGLEQIANVIRNSCNVGVRNGLINADGGTWQLADIEGVVRKGDVVKNGYIVTYEPVETLTDADRQARKSPPFYVYVVEAGAIHVVPLISIVVSQ